MLGCYTQLAGTAVEFFKQVHSPEYPFFGGGVIPEADQPTPTTLLNSRPARGAGLHPHHHRSPPCASGTCTCPASTRTTSPTALPAACRSTFAAPTSTPRTALIPASNHRCQPSSPSPRSPSTPSAVARPRRCRRGSRRG
ncbi:hypothetical protein VTK26DRAFT_4323 [Humicola hyalothermophila]